MTREETRLGEDRVRRAHWKRWRPCFRAVGDSVVGYRTGWTGLVAKLLRQSGE